MNIRLINMFGLCAFLAIGGTTTSIQAQETKERGKEGTEEIKRPAPGQRGGPGGRRGAGGGGRRPGGGGPGLMRIHPVLMAIDKDKDGKISTAEMENATAALKSLDKNKDGELAGDEIRPNFRRQGPGGGRVGAPGQGQGQGRGRAVGRPPGGRGQGAPEGRGRGRSGRGIQEGGEAKAPKRPPVEDDQDRK